MVLVEYTPKLPSSKQRVTGSSPVGITQRINALSHPEQGGFLIWYRF